MKTLRLFPLLAALMVAPQLFSADTFEGRITLNMKSGREKAVIVDYAMKEGLVRMEPKVEESGSAAIIFNWGRQEMIMLMPEQSMFMVMPMKAMTAPAGQPAGDHTQKVEKTGKTETILGYLCEQYLTQDGKETVEMWVTDKLGMFMGLSGGGGMMGGMMGGGHGGRQSSPSGWEQAIKGKQGFFPLRVIGRNTGGKETFRMDTTKIEPGPLPDSLFAPPDGFQKFEMPNFGGMNPFKQG